MNDRREIVGSVHIARNISARAEALALTQEELRAQTEERRRAEDKLKKLMKKDQEALRVARMGHWEFDMAAAQFAFNDQYYSLLGTTAEEADGYLMSAEKFANKYVHPDDAHLVREHIRQAIETNDPNFQLQAEARLMRANGEPQNVIIWFRVEKDPQGRTTKLLGVNQDITERKRAEMALKRSEESYRAIFDNANDALFLHDPANGKILDVNRKMCELYSYTHEEALNIDVELLSEGHPPYSQTEAVEKVRKACEVGPQSFEWMARDKSGRLFWADVSLKRVTLGRDERIMAVVRDITERKHAEEELKRIRLHLWHADRVAQTAAVAASLAHELNQPLGAILTNAEVGLRFMADANPDLQEIREIFADIVQDDMRAGAVVSGLRDHAAPQRDSAREN